MVSPCGDLPGAADAGHLRDVIRGVLSESSWLMWLGLAGAALGFVLSPVTTVGWPLPSVLLPRAVLERHADRFSAHPQYHLRQSATLIKLMAAFALARDPAMRAQLALPPWEPDPVGWRTS
jgi:hypothetical protein